MNVYERLEFMKPRVEFICDAIKAIENSDDKETVQFNIELIQEMENQLAGVLDYPARDIKLSIREGNGDYIKIKNKCIGLGLV